MTKVRYEEEGAERKDKKEEKMAIWRCPVDSEGGAGQSGREGALGEGWELWEREVVGGIKRSPLPISCVKRYSSTVTVSNSCSMTTSSKRIVLPIVQVSRSSRQVVYVS